ncbi:uncharacterized protein SEPMUDRAFT_115360 [Sphaerulina musiva SO2202]|uniref:Uncharacterized protein n=1 Tax=Sphaerulina musiva (strain SO2202) TaxID=692275 RepID=M3B2R3_SPHMS|nr:uncharacterized protein SEPMUDRAFT_115360 [Sphaerulina musiva SO2202]EMF14067.1 hypothetical protein SEPMUDRAFT_115360 [Sphaerulina musiva SO2202]
MGDLRYRLSLTILNIFFPPLALLIVCGPDMTFAVNCLLYIFAIIPSHIHGLYVSCVYFHRRRKVRKGRYPGSQTKALIYSPHVLNGGAKQSLVDSLYWAEKEKSPRS